MTNHPHFPCEDLRTIDQLWVKYSNGKFVFSVQKKIYQGLGGTRSYDEKIWLKFGDKVGWRKGGDWLHYQDITFDIKAQEGHLPRMRCVGYEVVGVQRGIEIVGLAYVGGCRFFSRVETCKL